jgi:beta-glucosidase
VISESNLQIVGFAEGFERNGQLNQTLIHEAVNCAEKADVVLLFIGLNEVNEVEGQDRSHIKLPENQVALIKALSNIQTKIVAIVSSGSVIEMPWADGCDAILHGYLSGQAGARAILNILTGKVNPSGKLSETYPLSYEAVPNKQYYPGEEKTSEYREGLYVGYRYYDKANQKVQFPFGYGLSYTTFEYSDLKVDEDKVRFKVTNTGNLAGAEVVQLYVGKDQDRIHRPVKELKSFKKVFLQPNEAVEIELPYDDYTFRYYDVTRGEFAIEKGNYTLFIASSSRDVRLSGKLFKDGIEPTADDSEKLKKYFEGNVDNISLQEFEWLYGETVPNAKWNRKRLLEINDSLAQMVYAKSLLARLAIKVLIGLRNHSVKKGNPDLNLFFLSNMPFRAIAKMSNGAFSMDMTRSVLVIVNGHFFRGTFKLIQSFISYRKWGSK